MGRVPSISGLPTKSRKAGNRPAETPIHIAIVDYLRLILPNALVFHPANGGKRNMREAVALKRMGVLAGVPDLVIITQEGRLAFLEVKDAKGTLSAPQKAFGAALDAAGVPWAVVRSVDDARRVLSLWGIETREAA
jgi:sporulation protein YlmC with PRC-barrel domain